MPRFVQSLILLTAMTSCAEPAPEYLMVSGGPLPETAYVHLSDGDSGYIRGITPEIHFRLHSVDTPEPRSMKQRGGAKCEAEIKLGKEASRFAYELTDNAKLEITATYGVDQFGRDVLDLSVDGKDMAETLIMTGHGKFWDYDGGAPKPNWCGNE